MESPVKAYPSVGCCGIDCGLCPRFHTNGPSACPGCGGPDFRSRHPSCGFLTCCVTVKGFEVCSDCEEFPCKRFDPERSGYDSFVTHRMIWQNLAYISDCGMESFIVGQNERISILRRLLADFDDGRSKSFFCLACTLLPADELREALLRAENTGSSDRREKSRLMREELNRIADIRNIDLRLNHKITHA